MWKKIGLAATGIVCLASLLISVGCDRNTEKGERIVSSSSMAVEEKESTNRLPVAPEHITLEDGTGIISLGMHRDEVIRQLEEWHLDYTLDYTPEISKYSSILVDYDETNTDHNVYYYGFDRDGILYEVELDITSKGLDYWDSFSKMKELYGDDYEYEVRELETGDQLAYCNYHFPNGTTLSVEVFFKDKNAERKSDGNVMERWIYNKYN